tara:strand:+ start:1182 stop:2204 length:1023 start_codon:yes stop_codon:yes gene_type:complete
MATLSTSNLTLADWAKRSDPDGRVPIVAELLSQSNEILEDCVFKEGNLPTGERVVIRTGLPSVYWRALNQGIPNSKSTTAQVDEACGILEARSEVDKDLAMLNGNTAQFRLSEDTAFLEAMNQTQAETMFYGNPGTDPKKFLGLAPRYSALSGANSSTNVISAGGSGSDNASVYLVVWGDQTVYCPFPKGSKAGLTHEDLGEQTVYNSDGTRLQAFATRYQWKNGLVVKDWRYVVRICNIDISDLAAGSGTQASTAGTALIKLMTKALYKIPNMSMGRAAFYMNRSVHSGLSIAALDKSQSVLAIQEGLSQFGTAQSYLSFLGVPLRRVDALLTTESAVS